PQASAWRTCASRAAPPWRSRPRIPPSIPPRRQGGTGSMSRRDRSAGNTGPKARTTATACFSACEPPCRPIDGGLDLDHLLFDLAEDRVAVVVFHPDRHAVAGSHEARLRFALGNRFDH